MFSGCVQHLERNRCRAVLGVDEKQLLLGSDARHAGLEAAVVEHLLQRPSVGQDLLHEESQLLGIRLLLDLCFAHYRSPQNPRAMVALDCMRPRACPPPREVGRAPSTQVLERAHGIAILMSETIRHRR